MKKCFLILTIINFSLIQTSCNNVTLSKEEVLTLANEANVIENCYSEIPTRITTLLDSDYNKILKIYESLEKLGLVEIRKTKDRVGFWADYYNIIDIHPTTKATEEYGFEPNTHNAIIKVAEITDVSGIAISEDKKEAKAIILISYTETPFAKLIANDSKLYQCEDKITIEKELNLVLYDTGWRIENL